MIIHSKANEIQLALDTYVYEAVPPKATEAGQY